MECYHAYFCSTTIRVFFVYSHNFGLIIWGKLSRVIN